MNLRRIKKQNKIDSNSPWKIKCIYSRYPEISRKIWKIFLGMFEYSYLFLSWRCINIQTINICTQKYISNWKLAQSDWVRASQQPDILLFWLFIILISRYDAMYWRNPPFLGMFWHVWASIKVYYLTKYWPKYLTKFNKIHKIRKKKNGNIWKHLTQCDR